MGKLYSLFIFTLTLLLYSTPLKAQQLLIDSLKQVIANQNTKIENKIVPMADLAYLLRYSDMPNAIKYGERALELGRRQSDTYYASYAYFRLYYIYTRNNDLQILVQRTVDSLSYYANRSKRPEAKALASYIAFYNANLQDDTDKAIPEALDALDRMDKLGMYLYCLRLCYTLEGKNNILEDVEGTKKYTIKGTNYANLTTDPGGLALKNLMLGDYYELKYRLGGRQQKMIDSSIIYLKESLKIALKSEGRLVDRFILGNAALNIAFNYNEYYPDIPRDTVMYYLSIAHTWASKINDRQVLTSYDALLAQFLKKEGLNTEAESQLLLAVSEITSGAVVDYDRASAIMLTLANIAEESKDAKKALFYYKEYMRFYDKVHSGEKLAAIKDMEAQFNRRHLEEKVLALENEDEMRRIVNAAFIILAVICLITAFYVFRSYRLKLNLSKQKEKLLKEENEKMALRSLLAEEEASIARLEEQEAHLKAKIKEENAARLEAEQLLIIQKNEQLQKELLAGAMHLNQKNNLLESLKEQISQKSDTSLHSIGATIKEHLLLDKSIDSFRKNLQNLHPDFFNRLQLQAEGKLTTLDLKYCAYIYMKMSSKEISALMNVEPKTVRMTKYRIKIKLKLDKEQDLDSFIENII